MKEQWARIEEFLEAHACHDQVALRPGASEDQIHFLEAHLGVDFPDSLKRFLSVHDGQSGRAGLVCGQQLLPAESIRQEWDMWRSLDEAAMNADCADFMASHPKGAIKPMYTNRAWIPLTKDWGGNHIGLDFDPDAQGTVGQVIRFGRDQDPKLLVAESFEVFVERLVASLSEAKWNGEFIESKL
jgi:cell wall assembly regulator SMI1